MKGFTVWFTGLPSSGKSTLAKMLEKTLKDRGFSVEVLDGDEVRLRLSKGLGFSKEDRDDNIRRIAFVANLVTRCGGVAITCAISPYRDIRDEARGEIGSFVEVYVKCTVEECIRRDVKGLYRKAISGEIKNFTGISDPYEEPLQPEIVVETDRETHEESIDKIITGLMSLGYLSDERLGVTTKVSIPTYLLPGLEKGMKENSFSDISDYITCILKEAIVEEETEDISVEERNLIISRLRDLGYID